jgi:hypothetical protein
VGAAARARAAGAAAARALVPEQVREREAIVGLYFPTIGCWEVNAKAGNNELGFVTEIKR